MNRDAAATYIGQRFSAYLAAVNRPPDDSPGNLDTIIDDALRSLGYADEDVAAADVLTDIGGYRLQLLYRALLQFRYDLAMNIDVSTEGDSFRLSQRKAAIDNDIAAFEQSILNHFGTLDAVSLTDEGAFITMDFNFLADPYADLGVV